jgi:hypothetical protein
MYSEIRLAISFKIESSNGYTTFHRLFKDSGQHCSAFPDHFFWLSNVDRYYLHRGCWLHTFSATFLILKGVQDASEWSVVPASLRVAMAREPLNQPSRFGLTSAPQAL